MSSTFVTLAEVLEARGGPLGEDEVWSLLLGAAESLLALSYKGHNNMCTIMSPSSLLLSAAGTVALKNCALSEEVSSFAAPEVLQGRPVATRATMEKVIVYSLGMTLYWSVDYHLPPNQPIQLSDSLNSLLLSMCEDLPHRRASLATILEMCEDQRRTGPRPPPSKLIKQLAEDVLKDTGDQVPVNESIVPLSGRSQLIRERLHGKRGPPAACADGIGGGTDTRRPSLDSLGKPGSVQTQKSWSLRGRLSHAPSYHTITSRVPCGLHRPGSSGSCLSRYPHLSTPPKGDGAPPNPALTLSESSSSLAQRKSKSLGPEFIRMVDEPQVILELPGSIVSKKGKLCVSQREVTVILPNEQCVVVKCDIKSRGRDVFDMVVAHANLVEHFYFGLAFMDDDEFFFLDHETKISKVAPDCWKKVANATFTLYLRVKFYADDVSFVLHRLTRHQYYLQQRKDILEDRLYCNEDTALYLAALALQAEFGDYLPEVYGRNYFQMEQYVPKKALERMALPWIREELPRLHASNAQMLPEEAEMEFLKISQQLPEYGVLFHRVARERKPVVGELVLGICAKGVIVYETQNHSRVFCRRFQWSETDSISTSRRKLTIECGPSGKKHTFVTESSKIAQYLLNLCSAQHKFHSEMTSRQLTYCHASDDGPAKYAALSQARQERMHRLSCSEIMLNSVGLAASPNNSLSKSCDNLAAKMEARLRQQRELQDARETPEPRALRDLQEQSPTSSPPEPFNGQIYRIMSSVSLQKQDPEAHSVSSIRVDTPTRSPPEREIVCVTLKKDPKLGFGFIIVGEDNTGKLDLGIFIASIVPDGPAEKDGRIRSGGRLISLNKISLEGVTFNTAAAILQNSPEEVELIVSQPKQALRDSKTSLASSCLGSLLDRSFDPQMALTAEYRPVMEELEEALTSIMTPKAGRKMPIPVVRILDTQDGCSTSTSFTCLKPNLLALELKKTSGSLGISVAGGVNTNVPYGGIYIKSLVPGGAAEQDGRVQIGDRLLEVDSTNLRGVTHKQAVECLKKTGEVVSLLLEREPPVIFEMFGSPPHTPTSPSGGGVAMETTLSSKAKDYSFVSDDNTLEVLLKKSLSGLGFSFLISELDPPDEGSVVRIKRLFPGQPAEESGLLQEGDVILSVNGEPVRDLTYQRVLLLLRGSGSEVKLCICRPAPGTLPDIDTCPLVRRDRRRRSEGSSRPREVRSHSLDLRTGRVTADFSALLRQKVLEKSKRGGEVSEKPQETPVSVSKRKDEAPVPPPPTPPPHSAPSPSISSSAEQDVTSPGEQEPPASVGTTVKSTTSSVSTTTDTGVSMKSATATIGHVVMTTAEHVPATNVDYVSTTSAYITPPRSTSVAMTTDVSASTTTASNIATTTASHVTATTASSVTSTTATITNHSSSYTSGVYEDVNGSMSYSLAGNGLAILADEEYLTITTTAASVRSCANTTSTAPPSLPPLPAPAAPPPSLNLNHSWGQMEEEEEDEDPRKDMRKEFELNVTLTKSWSGSFGFTIIRSKLDMCYYIQDVLDNPAKNDGRLRSGDRLISVNGHNVASVSDEMAMSILRSSSRRLVMTLGRAVQNLLPPPPSDSLPDIVLHKTPSGQLGIKLTGGIGSKWQGIYVLEVVPASPASEEGSIQPNDKIIYICGRCTMGMTLEDAVKACENATRKVKLKALREDQPVVPKGKWNGLFEWKRERFFPRFEESSVCEPQPALEEVKPAAPQTSVKLRKRLSDTSEQESCIIQVEFTKPARGGLGFALVGGVNGSTLRVKEICCGGVAEQDGRLRVGDILLEVNGVIVSGLSHGKVVDILRRAEGVVQLTVCRDLLPTSHLTAPSHDCSTCGAAEIRSEAETHRDHLTFLPSTQQEREPEQDSTHCAPCQKCYPALCVADMLQDSTDPRTQSLLEPLVCSQEPNPPADWSSDDDDEDDTAQPSAQEMLPYTGRPIVSEEELATLALVRPPRAVRYSGSRLHALIHVLQHQLTHQDPVKEFMALEHLKPSDNCLVGKAPENRDKNRYRDILPYDMTRVPVGESKDYINASYIRMEVGWEEFLYISTQGPLPCSVSCFWQMVWESKAHLIAMMTQEVERGKVKCHRYWPTTLQVPMETDRYLLFLDNCQSLDYFVIRVIKMVERESGDTHFVKHLKFCRWPDHGTPGSSEQLVRFLRYMRSTHPSGPTSGPASSHASGPASSPIVVHCSAGIGRTGVFICADVILGLIEKDLSINISEIVREMRLQRYGMVQTKEQYFFCYSVWLDVLLSIARLHSNQPNTPT